MMYVKFWGGNGYCGCNYEEYMKFEDKSEVDLDEYAYQLAKDNAEAYEYVVYGWDGPDPDEVSEAEYEEEMENYYQSIDWGYEVMDYQDWLYEQGIEEEDE